MASFLFESNGGQTKEKAEATVPEIRLAVGEPDFDIANVEPALDALAESCYFLTTERNATPSRRGSRLRPTIAGITWRGAWAGGSSSRRAQ